MARCGEVHGSACQIPAQAKCHPETHARSFLLDVRSTMRNFRAHRGLSSNQLFGGWATWQPERPAFCGGLRGQHSARIYEHGMPYVPRGTKKPNDLSHASCWVNYDRPMSTTLFAAAVRAGPAHVGLYSNHLPRSNGRPSLCKDVVGSHRDVFAKSIRPRRMHGAEEEAPSVLRH